MKSETNAVVDECPSTIVSFSCLVILFLWNTLLQRAGGLFSSLLLLITLFNARPAFHNVKRHTRKIVWIAVLIVVTLASQRERLEFFLSLCLRAYDRRSSEDSAMVVLKNLYMVAEMAPGHGLRLADVRIGQGDVVSAIHESLLTNFGEYGLAASLPSLQVKYVNGGTGVCVIRSSRKQYRVVWAAMSFITEIRNFPLCFNLLDLSGSTSACRRAALQCEVEKLRLLKIDKHSVSPEQLEHAESMLSRLASLD